MSERIEKIVKLICQHHSADRQRVTFGDVDFAFDPSCPNKKDNKSYNNITNDEWVEAYKIFKKITKKQYNEYILLRS